jgi:hypothetical protein
MTKESNLAIKAIKATKNLGHFDAKALSKLTQLNKEFRKIIDQLIIDMASYSYNPTPALFNKIMGSTKYYFDNIIPLEIIKNFEITSAKQLSNNVSRILDMADKPLEPALLDSEKILQKEAILKRLTVGNLEHLISDSTYANNINNALIQISNRDTPADEFKALSKTLKDYITTLNTNSLVVGIRRNNHKNSTPISKEAIEGYPSLLLSEMINNKTLLLALHKVLVPTLTEDLFKLTLKNTYTANEFKSALEKAVLLHNNIRAVKGDWHIIKFVDKGTAGYKHIALAAIKESWEALQFVNKGTDGYDQIALAAIEKDWEAIKYVNKGTNGYVQIAIAAVEKSCVALEFVDKDTNGYDQIALAAVEKNWEALKHVNKDADGYDQIALAAIKKDRQALQYVSPYGKHYRSITNEVANLDRPKETQNQIILKSPSADSLEDKTKNNPGRSN